MSNSQRKFGFFLLLIGSLFMVVVSAIAILSRITNYDVLVIRDIHSIFQAVYSFLVRGQMYFILLFLIGIFFLTDVTFKNTIRTILKVFSVVIIITYIIYIIFNLSGSQDANFVYDLYKTFFVIFCVAFIISLLLFEPKINYGVVILGAFVLQVFNISLPTFGDGEFFLLVNNVFQIFFSGLSYFLFFIYSNNKIK